MTPATPAPALARVAGPEDFAAAFHVSRETVARLEVYADLLRRWRRAVNLVAPNTLDDVWHRHFADSAQLLDLAPAARTWLDLGSGAGFPGMTIAVLLANRSGAMVTLVESNARKCAFLAEVARATGAPATVRHARIESLRPRPGETAPDIVTARALAPLDRLLGYAHPFFGSGTRGLFLKGRQAEAEVAAARGAWRFEARLSPSRADRDGRVVEVTGLAPRQGAAGAGP